MPAQSAAKRKSKVFKRFLISYVVILGIPLLIGFFGYYQYGLVLREKVGGSVFNMLVQTRDVIDVQLRKMKTVPMQVQMAPKLMSSVASGDVKQRNTHETLEMVKELGSFQILDDFIKEIAVLFLNDGAALTSANMSDIRTFMQDLHGYRYESVDEFMQDIRNASELRLFPLSGKNSVPVRYEIAFVSNLPSGVYNTDVKLMTIINETMLEKTLQKGLGEYEGAVFIINSRGDVIASSVKGTEVSLELNGGLPSELEWMGKGEERLHLARIQGREMLVSHVRSLGTQWSFISIVPSGPVFHQADKIRNTTVLTVAVTILLSLLLSVYFTNRHYKPVRRILEIFSMGGAETGNMNSNEWDTIETQIKTALDSKKELEAKYRMQEPVLRAGLIRKVLKGDISGETTLAYLSEMLGVGSAQNGMFAVMVMSVDRYAGFLGRGMERLKDLFLYKFSLCNIGEELSGTVGRGYAADLNDDRVAVLVRFNVEDEETSYKQLREIAENLRRFIEKNFEFRVTIGLGRIYNNLSAVKDSCEEACLAIDYKLVYGNNRVIEYRCIQAAPSFDSLYTLEDEKLIIDLLKRGDEASVKVVLERILEAIQQNTPEIKTVKCITYDILNTAMRVKNYMGLNTLESNKRIYALMQCETLQELKMGITEYYSSICSYQREQRESKNFALAYDILSFLQSNYQDLNLSRMMVADRFEISETYLSRFFKDHFGYNFNEYIQKIRIEKAKELLKHPDGNLNDIALKTGFGSVKSFIDTFKKLEGTTPGKYRETASM